MDCLASVLCNTEACVYVATFTLIGSMTDRAQMYPVAQVNVITSVVCEHFVFLIVVNLTLKWKYGHYQYIFQSVSIAAKPNSNICCNHRLVYNTLNIINQNG